MKLKQNIYPEHPILLVDDEEHFLLSMEMTLRSNGINNLVTCSDSRKAVKMLENSTYSLISLDINMPNISGLELLHVVMNNYPEIPAIMVSAVTEVEKAVSAMKMGAFDYIVKPVHEAQLVSAFRKALDLRDMRYENLRLKHYLLEGELENPQAFEKIITNNTAFKSVFKYCEAIAKTNLPILITGETGVGKELFANAIHELSNRSGKIITVNVAGVDDTLFADTLFGHKKGAFTGAEIDRPGLIEQAANGTIFLDEIGDLKMESQVKLLRLLQDGSYYQLGSDVACLSNARVLVATHRDIKNMKSSGDFRQDLFYRLQAHHITIPPLRQRKSDIPLLTNHFLDLAAKDLNKSKITAPRELQTLLASYSFPGNVRELEGMVFDSVSRHQSGVLSLQAFKEKISESKNTILSEPTIRTEEQTKISFGENLPTLNESEALLIEEVLKRTNGNQTQSAEILGLSRRALNNRLRRSSE